MSGACVYSGWESKFQLTDAKLERHHPPKKIGGMGEKGEGF